MIAFLRNLLATVTGLFIFFFFGFFILVGIISAVESSKPSEVKEGSVLYFPMSGQLMEQAPEDPILEALDKSNLLNTGLTYSLVGILEVIQSAKNDDKIKGIYLEPNFLQAGYAQLKEIRESLLDFKESGKFVYAYGNYISESDYYLVSVADRLFLNPTGFVEFNGLSAEITFFKGLFDKLEIEPQIFRVGDFKSYVEPFIRKDMSDQNRLQYSALINSVYGTYLDEVAISLGIERTDLKSISDQMKATLPEEAESLGLVHQVGYEDEIKSAIREQLSLDEEEDIPFVNVKKYSPKKEYSSNKIAVIIAEGGIKMSGDDGIIGDDIAKEIRKARENSSVKAIVLRVNSGGGSMTASDIIWREMMKTKGIKPLFASMSTAAASGGYYISMPADTIVAQPNTITGSIGIFGMLFNMSGLLENKLGITHDGVKTGDFSDIYTVTRKLNSGERAIIQRAIDKGYEIFTQKASEGRDMDIESLKAIAGGRVWSGAQALDNGLVDVLGGLHTAVTLAAEKANVEDDYRVVYYPKKENTFDKIINDLSKSATSLFINEESDILIKQYNEIKELQGVQARMDWLEIR